jgi:adenosylcobinamide-phosphate synthase
MDIINNNFIFVLIPAFFLDLAIGDPPAFPHPVKVIGKGITALERILIMPAASKRQEKLKGVFLTVIIAASTFFAAFLLEKWILFGMRGVYRAFGYALLVYLTASTIATKELLKAGLQILNAVKEEDIELARRRLSMVVGRDVAGLDMKDIVKATNETLSENLSDGIIAPLFYLTLGGLPLGMTYKAVNTLDSMVGYKNERYINFGWASARLDDVFNYIPARITGFLIAVSSGILFKSLTVFCDSLKMMFRDGKNHLSPNSGYPEASLAGALGVRLGGPSVYNGVLVQKPYIGTEKVSGCLQPSYDVLRIVRLSSFIGFFISVIVLFFLVRT